MNALLKHGAIPLHEFDEMPRKRLLRILELQEEILDEQQKEMERQRQAQEKSMKKMI